MACSLGFDGAAFTSGGDAKDGGGSTGGPEAGASGTAGTAGTSGTPPSGGGSGNASSGTIPAGGRLITFENGALVHMTTGVDATTGSPLIAAGSSALDGSYSLGVNGSDSFGTVTFPPRADLFVSFYVRINRQTPAQVLRIVLDQPGSELQLRLDAGKATAMSVAAGSTASFGFTALAVGQVRRIGIHYHAGTTSGEAELFAADGAGPMSRAGGTSSSEYRSTTSSFDIGATTSAAFDGSIDDIRIASDSFGP